MKGKPNKHPLESIRVEGNNGGDYIEIREREDDRIHLEVGHNCVKIIDHVVPVEFLTLALAALVDYHSPLEAWDKLREWRDAWDKEFMDRLAAQIEKAE